MRRIRMLEYALRMERSVLPSQLQLAHVNDMTHTGRSSSHSRLRSQCQSQSFIPTPRHPLKRTRPTGVHHKAGVRLPAALPVVYRYRTPDIFYRFLAQAMNILPNRRHLNNTSLPLTLPNVRSFDQIAYNDSPRKVMPEAGEDYFILHSMHMVFGPSPAGPGVPLERSNPMGSNASTESSCRR